ncbi:MAG: lamin tail domain-containing protein [Tannerellaceae bacterium]|jgi:hypothetical protein|nr:lamin tail domain-containing protein [Tannerellaceae bacterium]
MRKAILVLEGLLLLSASYAQMQETFEGGWIRDNYPWEGDTGKFRVNNGRLQLWMAEKGDALISLYGVPQGENTWSFTVTNEYAGTTANYISVYLWSLSAEEKKEAVYVRLGYTKKNVSLCQRKETGKTEVLIEGRSLFEGPREVEIKVEATEDGLMTLYSKVQGESQFVQEGTANLTLPDETGYFMIGMTYSGKHGMDKYVDDVAIAQFRHTREPEEPISPPEEPKEEPVSPKVGMLIISEVMANPKGVTGLKETEYVELCNLSEEPFSLTGCLFIYDGRKVDLGGGILGAGEYMVLYRSGKDITVDEGGVGRGIENFPAQLVNTGKSLSILDSEGYVIDSVWYPQAETGKSWEREGEWWYISSDSRGGTPGSANSFPMGGKVPVLPSNSDTPSSNEILNQAVAISPLRYDKSRKVYVIPYQVDRSGYKCKLFVYDTEGHRRAVLPISNLWNLQGEEIWDGCNERGEQLPYGMYIFYAEVYHKEGIVRHFKQVFLVHPR